MFCFLQNVKKNKTNDNRKEEKNRKQINFNIRIEWHLEANTNLEEHKMGGHVFCGQTVMFFRGAGQFLGSERLFLVGNSLLKNFS